MRVSFLGLGTMGAPMALNILRRGHSLTVWNRNPARAAPLAEAGARVAATPADAAAGAEVVITMLSDPPALDAVLDGPSGVLATLALGARLVDMSTVDPATARRVGAAVQARGAGFVDAPVSGTRKPAVDGTLVIFAGGSAEDYAAVAPVLEAMGKPRHMGAVGQGMAMKLVLNGLGAHMLTGFCAMLVLGVRQGLEPRAIIDGIMAGAFSSPLYAGKSPRMLERNFAPDFSLRLMLKDQELVLGTAASLGYPLPTLATVRDVLVQGMEAGLGEDDLAGLVQLFERWAGVTVG